MGMYYDRPHAEDIRRMKKDGGRRFHTSVIAAAQNYGLAAIAARAPKTIAAWSANCAAARPSRP